MPNSLSILPDGGRTRVFLCPACGETIALGCERCRFCSVVIDQQAASAAADLMDRVNQACSEADEIRALLPGGQTDSALFGPSGSRGDLYLVPILVLRWWYRFGSLRLNDDDLIRARRDMKQYALVLALVFAALAAFGIYVVGPK